MYDTILKSKQGGRFMKKMLLIALLLVGAISYGAGGLNLKFIQMENCMKKNCWTEV